MVRGLLRFTKVCVLFDAGKDIVCVFSQAVGGYQIIRSNSIVKYMRRGGIYLQVTYYTPPFEHAVAERAFEITPFDIESIRGICFTFLFLPIVFLAP